MLSNFSFNDAYRVITNVIDERIRSLTKSGAGVEVSWGTVASIDSEYTCSVYLLGEPIPSSGFRLENGLKPKLLDPVRVNIDKRGNRWIDSLIRPPTGLTIGAGSNGGQDAFLEIATERPWRFVQTGSGSSAGMRLYPTITGGKPFVINSLESTTESLFLNPGAGIARLGGYGRLRFVPLADTIVVSGNTTVDIPATTSSPQSALPTHAKVAQVEIWLHTTVQHDRNAAHALHYSVTGGPSARGASTGLQHFGTGLVEIGGDRQIRYSVDYGAGTVSYRVYLIGYFTDDNPA